MPQASTSPCYSPTSRSTCPTTPGYPASSRPPVASSTTSSLSWDASKSWVPISNTVGNLLRLRVLQIVTNVVCGITGGANRIERVYFEIKEANIEQWEEPQIKVRRQDFWTLI
ncbi:RYR2 [Cordylochernes scorpioides]|uniref:RYR2 n=1 Tax=Cordylochernes scorpioides TaxID=51811 RepID=A0ABY6K660_9ARAC|nr:RYR2 [Cordylochernes scorpioides]